MRVLAVVQSKAIGKTVLWKQEKAHFYQPITAQLTHLTTSPLSHGGYLFHVFLHLLRSEIQHEPCKKKKKKKKNVGRVHYLKNRRQGDLVVE